MRPNWRIAKKPDTAIGAVCRGRFAYRRGDTEVPTRLSQKDSRAWAMGWNQGAEDWKDPRRQLVPEIRKRTPRTMKTPPNDTEAAVLREAMQIAKARGWYVERRNTGAVHTDTSFFRYGSPGAADLVVVVKFHDMIPLHIEAEAKRRDGKGRLSESQLIFRAEMKKFGIPYIVFTSGEQFFRKISQICLDLTTRLGL